MKPGTIVAVVEVVVDQKTRKMNKIASTVGADQVAFVKGCVGAEHRGEECEENKKQQAGCFLRAFQKCG